MNQQQKSNAILFIKPNAEFSLIGDELEWLDKSQTKPTNKEIEAGWVALQAKQETEAKAKTSAKSALLAKMGISEDELRLLIG